LTDRAAAEEFPRHRSSPAPGAGLPRPAPRPALARWCRGGPSATAPCRRAGRRR
jgi:hypothetical protein